MNNRQLSRLQQLISRRLDRLVLDLFPALKPPVRGAGPATFLSGPSRKRVEEEWTRLCSEMGMSKGVGIHVSNDSAEEVFLFDPMPGGDFWLKMSMETANKILILGDIP